MCSSWIPQMAFWTHWSVRIFTFRESILFIKVINLIILLPVFGSIVEYSAIVALERKKKRKKPTKSNTKATAKMSKQIKCGKHTHRCTWNNFDDTHHGNGSYETNWFVPAQNVNVHSEQWRLLFKCSESNFSFSQSENKNGKHNKQSR